MADQNLLGDKLKLTTYSIVFTKDGYEAVLLRSVQRIVDDTLTAEEFVQDRIAVFIGQLNSPQGLPLPAAWRGGRRPPGDYGFEPPHDPLTYHRIPAADLKYLRVYYSVDARYAGDVRNVQKRKSDALEQIDGTLREWPFDPLWQLGIRTGAVIALRADNGRYLGRVFRDGQHAIDAAKGKVDAFAKFKVTVLEDDVIALQADNGQYLSRIFRDSRQTIEAAKGNIDAFTKFKVTVLENDQIALQADNSRYLGRINRGELNPIEAAKGGLEAAAKFAVIVLP